MKVVINSCHGGFGLSPLAIMEYLKRKEKECHFYNGGLSKKYKRIENISDIGGLLFSVSTKDVGKNAAWEDIKPHYFSYYGIDRTDKDLISVVEELGEKANGECARLSIVEIPDGIEWEISEYDGIETVEEKHRSWS